MDYVGCFLLFQERNTVCRISFLHEKVYFYVILKNNNGIV